MKDGSRTWLGVLLMALVLALGTGWTQNAHLPESSASNPVRDPGDLDRGFGGDPYLASDLQQKQLKRLRELHQKEVIDDTVRMEKLAAAMKDEVDRGNKTLNADVMKDADEIGKLAKRVSDRIKTQ